MASNPRALALEMSGKEKETVRFSVFMCTERNMYLGLSTFITKLNALMAVMGN